MWIAEQPVIFVQPNGSRREGRIAFGTPYRAPEGECRCPVALDGLDSRGPDIAGDSTLQALLLAVRFAAARLSSFREQGGRLFYPTTSGGDQGDDPGEEMDLGPLFGTLMS
ncbi:MAG: hypothetical protein U0270_11130 [Labilithrix sp.]